MLFGGADPPWVRARAGETPPAAPSEALKIPRQATGARGAGDFSRLELVVRDSYGQAVIPADLVPLDCPWPVVLGFDPGTQVAGYGAVVVAPDGPRLVCCGVIKPAKGPVFERLGHIASDFDELLIHLRPAILVVESVFAARNVRSALRIGEARGAVLAAAARRGVSAVEYAPAVAKKALVGHGAASKEQVAAMVANVLKEPPLDAPLDATDALSLALTHVFRMREQEQREPARS